MSDIIVPLDGSSFAEKILPPALTLARATGGRLRLLEAVQFPPVADVTADILEEIRDGASEYLSLQAQRLESTHFCRTTAVTSMGPTVPIIVKEANEPGVSFVAMTTHARHGLRRAVLGSVAENVLRESPVPVLLLPGPAEDRDFRAFRHMLLAVDGSALSQALIEPTAELALKLGAAVTLVRSYAPPKAPTVDEHGTMIRSIDQEVDRILLLGEQFMAPLVRRLKDLGVEAAGQIAINGHPAQGILSVGHEVQADLIVMATHGRSGLDRMRHGSVTEEVLRHSDLPLLAFGRVALHVLVKEPVAEATVAEPIRVSAPEVAF